MNTLIDMNEAIAHGWRVLHPGSGRLSKKWQVALCTRNPSCEPLDIADRSPCRYCALHGALTAADTLLKKMDCIAKSVLFADRYGSGPQPLTERKVMKAVKEKK